GGNAAAAWKVELLSAAGADVLVVAEETCDELRAIAADPPRGRVWIEARLWAESDLAGCAIAIGAFSNDAQADEFALAARIAGVPVNVIDKPAYCDFSFGSIVNRSPMVIGISTDGAAPIFAQAIRAKLEAMLPQGFALWAAAAARWRATIKASGLSFAARRQVWQHFTAHAVSHPNDEPQDRDVEGFIDAVRGQGDVAEHGSVTLVGAGPGDAELLTLRAVRALQSADVILFDDLVSREVLDFSRREAKKMLVGKTGRGPSCKQDEINTLMVNFAQAGKRVVRLKGGDPLIFGRAGEEIDACRDAGIAVEIVPGITAAQGAASRLGVSLTGRGQARRLQLVTGHARNGELPEDIDWRSVADPATTTAVYMPAGTLDAFVAKAIEAGLDPATPAVAIASATRREERQIAAPVASLPDKLRTSAMVGPVLVMLGPTMADTIAHSADVTARSAIL
ncbi:MAG: uroporphyrinogen-III C-methyltransferase, partial [Pseudolabrys sp.]|nr:uroporphyrinogen-III C-methyltransferase [Pseudolabrys sp.]